MRWLTRKTRADDGAGTDPLRGIECAAMSWTRVGTGYRLALVDDANVVVASVDLDRSDLHDTRRALTQVLRIRA